MTPPSAGPFLPLELERAIFEIAALSRPTRIPSLMLTAWRVKNWYEMLPIILHGIYGQLHKVEPLLYRVVLLCDSQARQISGFPVCTAEILRQVIAHKPPGFLNMAVKHLRVHASVGQSEVEAILIACDCVTNLYVYFPSGRLLAALSTFRCLRRLVIEVEELLALSAIDNASALATVTHLQLLATHNRFNSTEDPDAHGLTASLALIPHLTHISFVSVPPRNGFYVTLCANARIQCIVCFITTGEDPEDARTLADESRFVCIQYGIRREDWVRGTDGGQDYWARAEEFIAARRAGKIDPGEYTFLCYDR
ncbi:hypothetical protein B0H19DRAFT_529967 [Mycena capillaripes]|nr:hypothetical protein B0H19DRAFT_529967 [Mycena capillaripes]